MVRGVDKDMHPHHPKVKDGIPVRGIDLGMARVSLTIDMAKVHHPVNHLVGCGMAKGNHPTATTHHTCM